MTRHHDFDQAASTSNGSAPGGVSWRVGSWTVNAAQQRIEGPGGPAQIAPKALATLLCLAEHQGEIVSRETIFETVWSDTVVSDDTLNRAISDLRHLFGDSPKDPRVIETIRQRGYRLLVPAYRLGSKAYDTVDSPVGAENRDARRVGSDQRATAPSWTVRRNQWALGMLLCLGVVGFSLDRLNVEPRAAPFRAVPVTTAPGFEFDVALSFDGQQVAFVGASAEEQSMDLFVKRIGVETAQQVTANPRIEISPAWSPDGKALAFLAGDKPNGPCGLYVVDLPGGDERRMADCKSLLVTGVSWSPDGKLIAFSDRSSRNEPYRIYLLDVDSRVVTTLTNPPRDLYGDFSASFSPDGRSIAFVRGTVAGTTALILVPAVGDLHMIDLESRRETRLTFDAEEIPHIDWMPDGKHIVFASHRQRGAPGLWKIPAGGGDATWMMGGSTFVRKPVIARTGKRLVYEQWDNEVSIWRIELDSIGASQSEPKELIRSTHFDATPQFSPDGTRLAFTSQRSGVAEIWISEADGSRPVQLTSFGGPFTSTPRWSPDGTRLAFETRLDGQTEIFVVDAVGGPATRLTRHDAQDLVPSWSPDGEWVFFGSNRSGDWQIWRVPQGGGRAAQVTTEGGFCALSPPGTAGANSEQFLYYSRIDEPGLFRTPIPIGYNRASSLGSVGAEPGSVSGGASGEAYGRDASDAFGGRRGVEERILEDLESDDWGNWAPVDSGIYYYRRTHGQLAYFDFGDGSVRNVGRLTGVPVGMIGLSVSADRQLAFVRQRFSNADLWMVDDFE